jgi:hypothetical protein
MRTASGGPDDTALTIAPDVGLRYPRPVSTRRTHTACGVPSPSWSALTPAPRTPALRAFPNCPTLAAERKASDTEHQRHDVCESVNWCSSDDAGRRVLNCVGAAREHAKPGGELAAKATAPSRKAKPRTLPRISDTRRKAEWRSWRGNLICSLLKDAQKRACKSVCSALLPRESVVVVRSGFAVVMGQGGVSCTRSLAQAPLSSQHCF